MDSSISTVPILAADLLAYQERANRLLISVKWSAKPFGDPAKPSAPGVVAWRDSSAPSTHQEELSLVNVLRQIAKDPVLLPDGMNHTLSVVRQGLCVGMHLSKLYTKFSGLDQLAQLNAKGGLAELQKVEFRNKYQTASAVAVFGAASYVIWDLSQYRADEVRSLSLEIPSLPEVSLQDPVRALECFVFYLAALTANTGMVNGELAFVKAALLYSQAAATELIRRSDSLEYAEPFRAQVYQLEKSEFRVNGFTLENPGERTSVEFNRVRLDEIVGNREVKHQARRLASRLLCYDVAAKRNPMHELGGLPTITMGFGEPGTGKSLLIAALATMLDEYCSRLGVPFLFWPMPDTVVSTFQGGSAERMMSWMNALKDPAKIIYAPIDDAENNLEDRSRQGVSSGVREVVAVFLRHTEGAYAIHRGNALVQLFTNLPDQIDKAVLSRISDRASISGAVSRADFLDQDYLWHRKYTKLSDGFVNMKAPKDYEFLSAQAPLKTLSEVSAGAREPKEPRVRKIFEQVLSKQRPDSHEFFASLFVAVKQAFPLFTSRDIRNIQRAVDGRVLDFDFPESWFDDPELFFKKSYDQKREMLVVLMKENMGALSFADIRLEETVRYLDGVATIAETGKERRILQRIEDYELDFEAKQRLSEKRA